VLEDRCQIRLPSLVYFVSELKETRPIVSGDMELAARVDRQPKDLGAPHLKGVHQLAQGRVLADAVADVRSGRSGSSSQAFKARKVYLLVSTRAASARYGWQ
jgi:hypothetical protein